MRNKKTPGQKLKEYTRTPGSMILMILVLLSAVITFSVLLFLIAYILINGVPHLTLELFSWTYTSENASMLPSIINTLVVTFLSLLIAVPLGIFSAIYLVEYAKRGNKLVKVIRLTTETLSGIPSIGVRGIWAAVPIGWALADVVGVTYYLRHKAEIQQELGEV